jgi:hypothetical protein
MTTASHPINVAVLDDYQGVALSIVDWSKVSNRANLTVFQDHLADQHAVAERLKPFDVVCIMRERTLMPASLLERLPRLKLMPPLVPEIPQSSSLASPWTARGVMPLSAGIASCIFLSGAHGAE